MTTQNRITRALASFLLIALLVGCSSSEDRQAKYFERAQALYEEGDYKKAGVDVRNVLQINAEHPQALYLWALIEEKQQNWRQMFAKLSLAVELKPDFVDARIKLGQLYFRSQAFEQALEQADAILEIEPENADGHTLRGSVFYRQGDYEAAIEEAQFALVTQPGHVGAISILTEVYKSEDPERALAVIGDGIALQTQNATLKLLKARVLEGQGDTDGVIDVYKSLIAEYPENTFFHYRLVKFYEEHDRIDEAEELLRGTVKTRPDNLQLKLWLAEFIANQRNLSLAEATVKEFIANQPDIYELRFALGKIYTALRQYDEAAVVYREIIDLDLEGADSQYARNELVKLKLALGEEEQARLLLEEIFAIEPDNTDALLTKAKLEMAYKNPTAAIPLLRTIIKNTPASVDALLLLAQAHEATGNVDLALDNYRSALDVSRDNQAAVLNVARLEIAQKNYESAERLLEEYSKLHPGNEKVSQLWAQSYTEQGKMDEAIAVASALAETDEFPAKGLYLKGRVLYQKGDYAAAAKPFEQALQLEAGAVEALEYLTRSYLEAGQPDKANEYLAKHLEKNPEQAHAHELQGALYRGSNKLNEAIESYEEVLSLAPQRLKTYLALAEAYQAAGDAQSAVKVYDRGLEQSPNNASLLILKAGVYESIENFAAAAEVYESVLAIDEGQKIASNNLAMILVERFPSDESVTRALDITDSFEKTDVPTFMDTRGWVHYQAGDYASALPLLEKAVSLDGSTSVYRFHLGMTYFKLEDTESAKEELLLAVKSEANYPGIEEARETLRGL